jgi:hypothetical protein
MKKLHILCIAVFAMYQTASACTWIPTSFCETSNDRPGDVVISGKVLSVDDDGIDVEVIHVLQGTESREVIRIWDGTDFDCTGLFSMAASALGDVDDTIIVVMPLVTEIENTWDVIGDYRRPNYFGAITELRVTNGIIGGYIWGPSMTPVYQMPYLHLISNWNEGPDACSVFLSVHGVHESEPFTARLVDNFLVLSIPLHAGSGSTLRLLASNGQVLAEQVMSAGSKQVELSGLATGVYHVVLVDQNGTRSFTRVMKA